MSTVSQYHKDFQFYLTCCKRRCGAVMIAFMTLQPMILEAVSHVVNVMPDDKKSKAFRLSSGFDICDLFIKTDAPYEILTSDISAYDDQTLWRRVTKTHYFISKAFANNEYVVIDGKLGKIDKGRGKSNPADLEFKVAVPKVDLQWNDALGDAAKEECEDVIPALVVVSTNSALFAKLNIKQPRDDFNAVHGNVTLTWDNTASINVYRDKRKLSAGTVLSVPIGGLQLLVEAVKKGAKVKFTLEGSEDNVSGQKAVDYVYAQCVGLDFKIMSDKKKAYDNPKYGVLLDSRTATVTVTSDPCEVDLTPLKLSFISEPKEKGNLVNDGKGTTITFKPKDKSQRIWKTSEIYWYGVLPDRECYSCDNQYNVAMKVNGVILKREDFSIEWPEKTAFAEITFPATLCSAIFESQTLSERRSCCQITVVSTQKPNGVIKTNPNMPNNDFSWTGQYSDKIRAEETLHIRQNRGEVDESRGGMTNCFSLNGIRYFLLQHLRYEEDVDIDTYTVYAETLEDAISRAWEILRQAEISELDESNRVIRNSRGFRELKAKQEIGYNAAWRYHCTYQKIYGQNPQREKHVSEL